MKLLQDFIAPYVRVIERNGQVDLAAHHGTAFFIDSDGTFVTARHVVESCAADVNKYGGIPAIVMRKPNDDQARYCGKISAVNFADDPFDVAVGRVTLPSRACFMFVEDVKAWLWEDVYTAGYPETAVHRNAGAFTVDARGQKGHILRTIKSGHVLLEPHPAVIEISFPITMGMSGAPLVMRNILGADGTPIPCFALLGVCVANATSRLVDFSYSEVKDGGNELTETTTRIEEYGIAHDIRPLADWQPACLSGVTLKAAIIPSA